MVIDRWNDSEAKHFSTLLEQRVYSSRLLGIDSELVMHGGGNTSVKDKVKNLFGEEESVLFIKGSGWDLGSIEKPGFPGVRLKPLLKLKELNALSDPDMVNELRVNLIKSPAPDPSVECLLHAFLPFAFVDHTHADAVLTLTNQPDAERILTEIYGNRVGLVPYIMPGFQLSKECLKIFEKNPKVEALILLKHGVITYADTAKESYQRMIHIVQQAENYIKVQAKPAKVYPPAPVLEKPQAALSLHRIRSEFLKRQFPAILLVDNCPAAQRFVALPEVGEWSQRGPITPDHVIRTKRLPLLLKADQSPETIAAAFDSYQKEYQKYFEGQQKPSDPKIILDPWPRILLVPGLGVVSAGKTFKDARIGLDIYEHTYAIIENAERVGTYEALSAQDIFDVEYWVLEQAKLSLAPKALSLTGKIALISGGASGIGLAITKEFLAQGAVVHVLDINQARFESLKGELKPLTKSGNQVYFHVADLTKRTVVKQAVAEAILSNGGLDILILNAGIFPPSSSLENISYEDWSTSIDINLNGSFHLLSEVLPWMKTQKAGGDVIFIGSKNVTAPGPQAGAYSVAKAAQLQLARVCALENASSGIRVNTLHPHLIFDTGIWTPEIIAKRAKAYGLTEAEYKQNNLLKTELTSRDVARAALALASGSFNKTTGAQIPVDGGSDRTL